MANELQLQAQSIERINASSFIESRRDLRFATALTFAPDAMSPVQCAYSLRREDGILRLEIHAADVSELICPSTPIDDAAREKGAAIPTAHGLSAMLPPNLVWNTFDLKEGEYRLVLSVILDVDDNYDLVGLRFDESVIRVERRCLYDEIDELLISNDASSVLSLRGKYKRFLPMIEDMYSLSAELHRKRHARGGMQIDNPIRCFLTNDNAETTGFKRIPRSDSEMMLYELTVFASSALGTYLAKNGCPALFFSELPPEKAHLLDLARAVGIEVDGGMPESRIVNDLVDLSRGSDVFGMVCDEIRLSAPLCRYSDKPVYNAVAACDTVVLFNRPATRYSDILMHRLLKNLLHSAKNEGFSISSRANYFAGLANEAEAKRRAAELQLDSEQIASVLSNGGTFPGYYFGNGTVILDNNAKIPCCSELEPGKRFIFSVSDGKAFLTV